MYSCVLILLLSATTVLRGTARQHYSVRQCADDVNVTNASTTGTQRFKLGIFNQEICCASTVVYYTPSMLLLLVLLNPLHPIDSTTEVNSDTEINSANLIDIDSTTIS
jgi:hypothetical protein